MDSEDQQESYHESQTWKVFHQIAH